MGELVLVDGFHLGNGDGEISAEDFYNIMTKKTFP